MLTQRIAGQVAERTSSIRQVWAVHRTLRFAIFLLIGLSPLLLLPKGYLVEWSNALYGTPVDAVMKYGTHLGDGLVLGVLIGLAILWDYKMALWSLLTSLILCITVQGLKRGVFAHVERPKAWFDQGALQFVDGVDIHSSFSFPSGHAATAMAFSLLLCFFIVGRRWHYLVILLGALIGYSRVYLAQHFFFDIWCGFAIAILTVYAGYRLHLWVVSLLEQKNIRISSGLIQTLVKLFPSVSPA